MSSTSRLPTQNEERVTSIRLALLTFLSRDPGGIILAYLSHNFYIELTDNYDEEKDDSALCIAQQYLPLPPAERTLLPTPELYQKIRPEAATNGYVKTIERFLTSDISTYS